MKKREIVNQIFLILSISATMCESCLEIYLKQDPGVLQTLLAQTKRNWLTVSQEITSRLQGSFLLIFQGLVVE